MNLVRFLPWSMFIVGGVLFLMANWAITRAGHGSVDPLRAAGLTSKQRLAIRASIRAGTLPTTPPSRALALEMVRHNVMVGPSVSLWTPFFYIGIALMAGLIYLAPQATWVGVIVQTLVLIFGVQVSALSFRMMQKSKVLLSMSGQGSPAATEN